MKTDILNRADIEQLISSFYAKAKTDALIGHFFTSAVVIDWDAHLPIMCSFWENALFYSGGYSGDMMAIHRKVNSLSRMEPAHFERWTLIFCQTVDQLFEGQVAETAKQRALGMATMLQIKIPVVG